MHMVYSTHGGEEHGGYWYEHMKERDNCEDLGVGGRMWNGFIWLTIGSNSRIL
jgi:hypothetical protein